MFDVDKILGKKKTKNTSFTDMSMSKVLGKNPFSDVVGKFTNKPLRNMGASPKMQNKWKGFSPQKRNLIRKTHKDSDGDRIPNVFDCSPFNVMKQDKTFWPVKLKEQNISFIDTTPRQQRIIEKQLRKNPELLARKNKSSKLVISVDDTSKKFQAFGVTRPINKDGDMDGNVEVSNIEPYSYGVTLDKSLFNQQYDPKFNTYIAENKPGISLKEKHKVSSTYIQKYKNPSRNAISRTLSHEIQHVNQIDKHSEGDFYKFINSYNKHPSKFEEDADKLAYDQRLMFQDRKTNYETPSTLFKSLDNGASIQKQNQWKNMSGSDRDVIRASQPDTDGDRIPDEYDCQPDNTMAQDSSYLYTWQSPDVSVAANESPSHDSTLDNMSFGRSTGWTGTGIYAYNDKLKAVTEGGDIFSKERKLYKIKVKKPFVSPGRGYDDFMKASKHHRYLMFDEDGFDNDRPLVGQTLKEYRAAGIKTTEKQLRSTAEHARKNNMLPSSLLLKEQGFDSVIADNNNNTYRTGSVVLGKQGDFKNRLILTNPDKITDDEYDFYNWSNHEQKSESSQHQQQRFDVSEAIAETTPYDRSGVDKYKKDRIHINNSTNLSYLDKYKNPHERGVLIKTAKEFKEKKLAEKEKEDEKFNLLIQQARTKRLLGNTFYTSQSETSKEDEIMEDIKKENEKTEETKKFMREMELEYGVSK